MKRFSWSIFLLTILLLACKEDEEPVIKVTYEVITSGGAEWEGEFDDENGTRINSFEKFGLLPSGWKYEFEPNVYPITVTIHGTAHCTTCAGDSQRLDSEDLTVNLYINDELVQTQTNTCRECTIPPIKGMATAWMKLPEELEN